MTDPQDPYDDFAEPTDDTHAGDPPPLPAPSLNPDETKRDQDIDFANIRCVQCGYNLTGVTIGGACPECGARVDLSLYAAGNAPASGKAISSMVLGICSIPTCCCLGLGAVPAIIGLIFGVLALNDLKTGRYSTGSRGMAIAGLWCSGIGLGLGLIYWLLQLASL